jgi:hypothetical protein
MASAYPFRQIIGLEFSPELHRIAEGNITRYFSPAQKGREIRSWFGLHEFHTSAGGVGSLHSLIRVEGECWRMLRRVLGDHCSACPRPLYLAYVAPRPELDELLASAGFLKEIYRSDEMNFRIYQGGSGQD